MSVFSFSDLRSAFVTHACGCARDPDVGKREKLDAALDDYWGKEDAMEEAK